MSAKLMTMRRKETVVAAGKFKAECLALLDLVSTDRCSIVVTKRGRPVARVVPLHSEGRRKGSLLGSLLEDEGLLDPVDVEWDANG